MKEKLSIGFIGAGRAGVSLGRYFYAKKLKISGFCSRTAEHARSAALLTESRYFVSAEQIAEESDILFITVPDSVICEVYLQLKKRCDLKDKILCHCSGALPAEAFKNAKTVGAYAYSVHPAFAINDKENSYKELHKAFFTVQGSPEKMDIITSLIEGLGNPYRIIDAEQKIKYHVALASASNLVIGLYHMSARLLGECGFTEAEAATAIAPLFLGNARSLTEKGCAAALTGPVDRNDYETVCKHLSVLEDGGRIEAAYRALSSELVFIAKDKYPSADYTKLEKLLNNQKNLHNSGRDCV